MGSGKTTVGRLLASGLPAKLSPSDASLPFGPTSPLRCEVPPLTTPRVARSSGETYPASTIDDSRGEGNSIQFIDLDLFIEKQLGRKVQEIFAKQGEAAFRKMELEALQEAISSYEGGTLLIALGGGTLMTPECRELVRLCSHCIYLRASAKTLAGRLQGACDASGLSAADCQASGQPDAIASRPLLAGEGDLEAKLAALLAVRGPVYEAASQHIIDTDGLSPSAVASEVLRFIDGSK
ncbi:MAG: hypothetical protein J5771_02455 [Bacteroidales bacterium]|nr:hypothetical protein [Bacteroidales bacterium]